jgi:uncharacterized membrane protein YraQ (UPF0718 family)
MWMLAFVPDAFLAYIVNAILIAGAIGTFFTFFILHRVVRWFPAIAPYHLILQIISIVLLVAGVYLKGGYGVEMEWREKLRIAEERARAAEEQAKVVNEKIVIQYRDRVKTVKENVIVYQDRIKEVEKIINQECKVAPQVIDIHNDAAKNKKAEANK